MIFLFCHSYKSPIDRIVININIEIILFVVILSIGYDKIIAISTSKIKNRSATRKNWKENGIWTGFMLLNPHSKGLHFSFVAKAFFFVNWITSAIIVIIIVDIIHITEIFIFYFIFLIGNKKYYFILKRIFKLPISIALNIKIIIRHPRNVNIKQHIQTLLNDYLSWLIYWIVLVK